MDKEKKTCMVVDWKSPAKTWAASWNFAENFWPWVCPQKCGKLLKEKYVLIAL